MSRRVSRVFHGHGFHSWCMHYVQVVSATKNYNWDGKNTLEQQWSFAGAMLYSITVITTIGSFLATIIIIIV